MQKVTGYVQDSSKFLHYHWWQPVYYLDQNSQEPGESSEKRGRWCGIAEDVGDVLTYWILTDDTKQLLAYSDIRPVTSRPNTRADLANSDLPLPGEESNTSEGPIVPRVTL